MEIAIDRQLKGAAPRLAVGAILTPVEVTKRDLSLGSEIDTHIEAILASMKLQSVCDPPQIKAIRDAYRSLGKDPSRYRGSQEALFRRILQGRGLFRINTVVDINNLVSLESVHSVGSYDFSQLDFPITFRVGRKGEVYKGIGKENVNLEGLPIRRWQRSLRKPHERLGESDDHYKYKTGHNVDNCIFWVGRIARTHTSRSSVALAVCESAERRSQATRG